MEVYVFIPVPWGVLVPSQGWTPSCAHCPRIGSDPRDPVRIKWLELMNVFIPKMSKISDCIIQHCPLYPLYISLKECTLVSYFNRNSCTNAHLSNCLIDQSCGSSTMDPGQYQNGENPPRLELGNPGQGIMWHLRAQQCLEVLYTIYCCPILKDCVVRYGLLMVEHMGWYTGWLCASLTYRLHDV